MLWQALKLWKVGAGLAVCAVHLELLPLGGGQVAGQQLAGLRDQVINLERPETNTSVLACDDEPTATWAEGGIGQITLVF